MNPPTAGRSVDLRKQTTSYSDNNSNNFNGNTSNMALGKVSADGKTYSWYSFDKVPHVVMYVGSLSASGFYNPSGGYQFNTVYPPAMSAEFGYGNGFCYMVNNCSAKFDNNTLSWYSTKDASYQLNSDGITFYFVSI